ncbi:MAG: metallophosphoesterase family protein [Verrucomicrobiota bacterium]
MRLAVLSDIHGNAQSLRAVLAMLDEQSVDRYVCSGDVVGYGPSPAECIDIIRERQIRCVMGNHDEYVTQQGAQDSWKIRDDAKESILWTQSVLSAESVNWLAALPMMIDAGPFQVVHASPLYWPRWRYITNPDKAAPAFLFQKSRIAFNGHTHLPILAAHRRGHPPVVTRLKSGRLPPSGEKFLIGVGAVGQPRDKDPRASVVLIDSETLDLRHLRVPYDFGETQRRIRQAGLPQTLADRLAEGR